MRFLLERYLNQPLKKVEPNLHLKKVEQKGYVKRRTKYYFIYFL